MIGRRWLVPALWFLMFAAAGCAAAGGPQSAREERPGESERVAAREETAMPGVGRTEKAAPQPARTVSLGGAYMPAGYGEGSLWATDIFVCNDTGPAPSGQYDETDGGASGSSGSSAACAAPASSSLKRLDPQTGEEVAAVELGDFFANVTEVASGAGSVWVSSADQHFGPADPAGSGGDAVLRVDPGTNRVAGRTPVPFASGVAFGHGSAWATSDVRGTLTRIDPETGGVAAQIEVGRGAVDVAVDERPGGDVWVAGLYLSDDYGESPPPESSAGARKLTRVDPETNRVVAEIPIGADSPEGGAQSVAVGEGSVWAQSSGGRLLRVDPRTNGVVDAVSLGDYSSHLAVSGGFVWATAQTSAPLDVRTRLARVDPSDVGNVWTEDLGPVDSGGYGRLAADAEGNVWFVKGDAKRPGTGTLTRISP